MTLFQTFAQTQNCPKSIKSASIELKEKALNRLKSSLIKIHINLLIRKFFVNFSMTELYDNGLRHERV